MPFFSNLFKRDASSKSRKNAAPGTDVIQIKPRWEEAWSRKEVSPEEVQELIHECSQEMKSRGEHSALYNGRSRLMCTCSSGYALPPPPIPTRLRSCWLKKLHTQLLQDTIRWDPSREQASHPTGASAHGSTGRHMQLPQTSGNTAHIISQVLCSIMKWCWNRLPGGVVSWETYELFRTGEIGQYLF